MLVNKAFATEILARLERLKPKCLIVLHLRRSNLWWRIPYREYTAEDSRKLGYGMPCTQIIRSRESQVGHSRRSIPQVWMSDCAAQAPSADITVWSR